MSYKWQAAGEASFILEVQEENIVSQQSIQSTTIQQLVKICTEISV